MSFSNNQFIKNTFSEGSGSFSSSPSPSSNSFADNTISKGSGSFSSSQTPSGNSFSDTPTNRADKGWEGTNLTGGAYGAESAYGGANSAYGVGEYGGLEHFRNRTKYSISH